MAYSIYISNILALYMYGLDAMIMNILLNVGSALTGNGAAHSSRKDCQQH